MNKSLLYETVKKINFFEDLLCFVVFLDLSLCRGWSNVKIIKISRRSLVICGVNKARGSLEIFIPIDSEIFLTLNDLERLLNTITLKKMIPYLNYTNLAFVSINGTITYYRFDFNLHCSTGPKN
mmetsp:Transcript_25977/g.40641  ORF Transcript_25977/g.40641 Transcript_25977/m.40641 type:complete len:124 (-) Transcript_25977:350-721(-)